MSIPLGSAVSLKIWKKRDSLNIYFDLLSNVSVICEYRIPHVDSLAHYTINSASLSAVTLTNHDSVTWMLEANEITWFRSQCVDGIRSRFLMTNCIRLFIDWDNRPLSEPTKLTHFPFVQARREWHLISSLLTKCGFVLFDPWGNSHFLVSFRMRLAWLFDYFLYFHFLRSEQCLFLYTHRLMEHFPNCAL